MKKISKRKNEILKKYNGVKVQERKPFNEVKHKLIAKQLRFRIYYHVQVILLLTEPF